MPITDGPIFDSRKWTCTWTYTAHVFCIHAHCRPISTNAMPRSSDASTIASDLSERLNIKDHALEHSVWFQLLRRCSNWMPMPHFRHSMPVIEHSMPIPMPVSCHCEKQNILTLFHFNGIQCRKWRHKKSGLSSFLNPWNYFCRRHLEERQFHQLNKIDLDLRPLRCLNHRMRSIISSMIWYQDSSW